MEESLEIQGITNYGGIPGDTRRTSNYGGIPGDPRRTLSSNNAASIASLNVAGPSWSNQSVSEPRRASIPNTSVPRWRGLGLNRPSWMQSKKPRKKVKVSLWEHEFVCLSRCDQSTPPSLMEKMELIQAGLGPKKIPFFQYGEPFEFHNELVLAFPKLSQGGGYSVKYLKPIVNQAKVFVRPIQKNLDISPVTKDKNNMVQLCVNFQNHCKILFT